MNAVCKLLAVLFCFVFLVITLKGSSEPEGESIAAPVRVFDCVSPTVPTHLGSAFLSVKVAPGSSLVRKEAYNFRHFSSNAFLLQG